MANNTAVNPPLGPSHVPDTRLNLSPGLNSSPDPHSLNPCPLPSKYRPPHSPTPMPGECHLSYARLTQRSEPRLDPLAAQKAIRLLPAKWAGALPGILMAC